MQVRQFGLNMRLDLQWVDRAGNGTSELEDTIGNQASTFRGCRGP